jgi:membrane-anchored protein YejM (alkaline phosphatase superfamily)
VRGAVAAFLLVNVLLQAALYRWRLDDVLGAVLDLDAQAGVLRRSSMGFALYGAGLIALILLVLFQLLSTRPSLRRPAALIPLVGATLVTIAVYVDTTVFKDHGVHFYEFDVLGMLSNAWLVRDLGIRPQDLAIALAFAAATLVLEGALFVGLRRSVRAHPWVEGWSARALVACIGVGLGLYGTATPRLAEARGELLESLPLRPVLLMEERTRPHIDVVPKLGRDGYPVAAGAEAGPALPRVTRPRNVVFFLGDGFRADHLTADLTPNLRAFAERGDVIAPARALSTGHATEMGLFGLLYGLDSYHYHPFALASVPPFPLELLRASGYVTAFVSGSRLNKYPTDFMAEAFDQVLYPESDDEIVPLVERFLAERRADGRPYFLLLFFYTPHYPFDTVEPGNQRFHPSLIEDERNAFLSFDDPRFQVRARNSYRNSVIQADTYFRRVRDLVEDDYEAGRTALVATSDHGTEFWEHGLFGHGRSTFWKEKVEVPLMIGLGGGRVLPADVRRPALASVKDVWPTVMETMALAPALAPQRWTDGLSLLSTPLERVADRTDVFVAGRYFPWADRPNLMVVGGRKHWLRVTGPVGGRLAAESVRITDLDDRPVDPALAVPAPELAAALTQRFWRFLAPARGPVVPTFAGGGGAGPPGSP